MAGAPKLDHLQSVKLILSRNISNLSAFILGSQFLLPQRERKAENGEMEFSQPEWDTVVWVPGAFKLDGLQPVKPILFLTFSNFYIFILGSQILITPERGRLKMGKWNSPNLSKTQGFECLGYSNWTICSQCGAKNTLFLPSIPFLIAKGGGSREEAAGA